jgi:hypothetical protein
MNQRILAEKHIFIPPVGKEIDVNIPENEYLIKKNTEDVIFDQAIEAGDIDKIQVIVTDFEDKIKDMEKKVSALPEDISSDKIQTLESLKEKEAEIRKTLSAILATSKSEDIGQSEGIIRLKALEHLKTIADSVHSEFITLCDDVEKYSCDIEEPEISDSSIDKKA